MKKAVIYARYSSHKQREESIERQLEICHKFAEDNDYEVIAEYCDREQSGRTDNRLNFQKMMKDAERREFDAVIILKQDRFARNRADSQQNKLRLGLYNIRVLSATEPIPEGSSGILMESLLEGIAEYYSAELSEKVTSGMRKNILKGTANGSYRPYGYDIVEKKYVVNPYEAEVVQKIFEKYANGDTVKSIIEYCCDRGYKTAQGRDFGYCYIERILKNKKYIGIYSWADIEKSDSIEAIIDERLFNKVQKRIEENANTGARENAVVDYVLSGKAYCGHCEQPLVADSVTKTIKNPKPEPKKEILDFNLLTFDKISELLSEEPEPQPQAPANKKIYRYYVCRGRKEKAFLNGCHKNRLDKDKLENAVIEYTAKQYLCDENIEELAKAIYKVQSRVTSNPNIQELEYKILEEAKKIENLYVMVESGKFSNHTFDRIQQAELRKEDYEKELRRIKREMPRLELEQIREKLGLIRVTMESYVKHGTIPIKLKKAFCDAFIEKVYVFDDDDGDDGNGKNKKTRVKIIFDAFESEGLLGFDEAEIEISSKMETLGSPKKQTPLWGVCFFAAGDSNNSIRQSGGLSMAG